MVIQNCLRLLRDLAEIEDQIREVKKTRESMGLACNGETEEQIIRELVRNYQFCGK